MAITSVLRFVINPVSPVQRGRASRVSVARLKQSATVQRSNGGVIESVRIDLIAENTSVTEDVMKDNVGHVLNPRHVLVGRNSPLETAPCRSIPVETPATRYLIVVSTNAWIGVTRELVVR